MREYEQSKVSVWWGSWFCCYSNGKRWAMATPQWVLLQRRLMPQEKVMVSQFSINAEKRLRDAVMAAKKKGFLRALDEELINETQVSLYYLEMLVPYRRFACRITTDTR